MNQADLKYELRVNQRAWFIRFFVWLYEPHSVEVNFCALFWGYLFVMPVLLLKYLVVRPIDAALDRTRPKRLARKNKITDERRAAKLSRVTGPPPEPSWTMRFLHRVGDAASRAIYAIGSVWSVASSYKRVNRVVVWIAWLLGALIGIAATSALVVLFIDNFGVSKFILAAVCALVLFVLALIGLSQIGFKEKVLEPVGHGVKRGFLGFFETIGTGFHAVKTNTCPRIVLVDDDTEASAETLNIGSE